MKVLGIDPGYAIVGYGVVQYQNGKSRSVDHGAITTRAGTDFNLRLAKIYEGITYLLRLHQPDAISIEKLYFQNNQKTAIQVAEARGVILLAAVNCGVEIFEYTPLQVKVTITGYGKAQKPQIMAVTKGLLNLAEMPKPDDTADALALAICHCRIAGSSLKRRMLQDDRHMRGGI